MLRVKSRSSGKLTSCSMHRCDVASACPPDPPGRVAGAETSRIGARFPRGRDSNKKEGDLCGKDASTAATSCGKGSTMFFKNRVQRIGRKPSARRQIKRRAAGGTKRRHVQPRSLSEIKANHYDFLYCTKSCGTGMKDREKI
mmetsp:Transcript_5995/g.12555  ORF Transcript_5995/g.12555 Transcript_5995/m.12555 type:complete len:142 (+) Transcript_5995:680-1105(+)